jgi:hypothetical protein
MRRRLALSRHDLHARLRRVDAEGWDGPAASELLGYVRENLVRIQVSAAGLSGPAAGQAEATGWEAAWEVLASPAIRTAPWPWSLLRIAVRRAVRGEWAAGLYLTKARTAWELRAQADRRVWEGSPVSWDRLVADGYEPVAAADRPGQPLLAGVVGLLVEVGWEPDEAAEVVLRLAEVAVPGRGGTVMGWRLVAAEMGLPQWQVHRVVLALEAAAAERFMVAADDNDVVVDPSDELKMLCATTTRHRGNPPVRTQIAS